MGTAGTTGVSGWRQEGVWGNLEPGPRFPGGGAVPGSPATTDTKPLFSHFERSAAGVILTSASRSGGEVRITEAERSDHVFPGRKGMRQNRSAQRPHGSMLSCAANMRRLSGHGADLAANDVSKL